jgi:acetyltransferase-like isoleucine patch superfamily enzyme
MTFKRIFASGRLAHIFFVLQNNCATFYATMLARTYLGIWGIHFGKGCSFGGMPMIRKYPGSEITIGEYCRFNSRTHFNFIGINHPVVLSTHNSDAVITIGNRCGFSGTSIGCGKNITIGNQVRCGANTVITDTDWHTDDPRTTPDEPVVIEDNVWIGLNVTVLKGSRIGEGSFIASGSIVSGDIPSGVVAGGIPAKTLRSL